MADPRAIIDAKARSLFDAHVARQKGRWTLTFWRQGEKPNPSWDEASNWTREEWRTKALTALRSEESLADELRREDRERRSTITLLRNEGTND